jgi:Family of unknown function (DUF6325)
MVRNTRPSPAPMGDSVERRSGADTDTDLVEYMMIAVPELSSLASLTPALADLVASKAIRILDLVCVVRSASGASVTVLELEEVESITALRHVEGDVGGLFGEHDIEMASLGLSAGSSALLLMVEDRWAGDLSSAARDAGGRVIGGGRIARERIAAALRASYDEPSIEISDSES